MAVATEHKEEVDLSPGSPAWERLISASKVAGILGMSPWSSPLSTWHEMRQDVERDEFDEGLRKRGHALENAILDYWEMDHEGEGFELHRQVQRWCDDWGFATLDGLAVDPAGKAVGVEAKTTSRWETDYGRWGDAGTDQIPKHYMAQVWWQFICAPDVETIYVPVLGPFLDFREYVVHRSELEVDLGMVLEEVKRFYDSLAGDEPPPLDDHKATVVTFTKLNRDINEGQVVIIDNFLAAEYVDAALSLKAAEARERLARANVLKEAGNAQYVDTESGVRIARRQATQRGVSLYRQAKSVPPVV